MATRKAKKQSRTARKQWTVMIYLAGDNDLDSAGVADLAEMKKIGSTDDVHVIAQFDRRGSKRATLRYYLSKGGTLAKDAVADLGETNMGDPKVLKSFIEWGFKNYPAERNLVVLWNHGAGWDDEDIYRAARRSLKLNVRRRDTVVARAPGSSRGSVSIRRVRVVGGKRFRRALFSTTIERAIHPGGQARAIAFDDTSKDFLDNIETKKVLASVTKGLGRKIDILGMDACLMSMAEVCYQVRDSVQLTVGSEEVEPGDGWPYDKILGALVRTPKMSPQELAKVIVDKYLASYGSGDQVTQSACDLTKAKALAQAVHRLGKTLESNLSDDSVRIGIVEARSLVQSYDAPDYIDLFDFCEQLEASCSQPDVQSACQDVQSALEEERFVIRSGFKGDVLEHSNGCAIYFPQRTVSPLYATLDFSKQTAWDDFLKAYLRTRRRGRTAAAPRSAARPPLAAREP